MSPEDIPLLDTSAMAYGGLCLKTMTAAPTDPLLLLPPGEFRRLADEARASLCARVPPATRRLLERGRCRQIVIRRMQWLLAQNPPARPPGREW